MSKFALYYESEAYALTGNVMGRQSAGAAFLRAAAAAAPERVWCFSKSQDSARDLARQLADYGAPKTGVEWISFQQPERAAEAGLFYRPDPIIGPECWRRTSKSHPRSYSVCGITHTTASHAVMDGIAELVTAPVEDWDAVICTSRAVRDSVSHILEAQATHLTERLGATRFSLPQLPIIPLGVHGADYDPKRQDRRKARTALGIAPDHVVVLFVGRLSFHGKAHPMPMLLGLEACAKDSKITLVQAGWFANEAIDAAFRQAAQQLAPSVNCLFVDGRDQARLREAWAAADIFTSLSDNIQETFGLTPVEAMAAGLPVVVTDWDGYRDTVRDGIDGFRVPTMTLPGGSGGDFADLYDLGFLNYDHYSGYTSQMVAVDIDATAEAYRKLITDPALRKRMGEAGRRRALAEFDWSVIFGRYQALWADLGERRRSNPVMIKEPRPRRPPARPDPFSVFASYPTRVINAATRFARRDGATRELAIARRSLDSVVFARGVLPSDAIVDAVLEALPTGTEASVAELAKSCGVSEAKMARVLLWLAKAGILRRAGP